MLWLPAARQRKQIQIPRWNLDALDCMTCFGIK